MSISCELPEIDISDFDFYKDIPDFYKNDDLSEDGFFNDGYHDMTKEESKIYYQQITESDGFDVDPIPKVLDCGLIQPNHYDSDACFWAEYAIDHNNASQGVKLQLDKVVKTNTQPACPRNHYITFTATDTITGVTKTYQAKVFQRIPRDESEVDIFREKAVEQYNEADTVRFLAIFAINHYNRTEGEDLRLINVITCDQRDGSLTITFKATDLSTCMTEFYRTEVVTRAPIVKSTVKYFIKLSDPSTYHDEKDEEESKAASIISGLDKMEFSARHLITREGQGLKIKEHDARSSTSRIHNVMKKKEHDAKSLPSRKDHDLCKQASSSISRANNSKSQKSRKRCSK